MVELTAGLESPGCTRVANSPSRPVWAPGGAARQPRVSARSVRQGKLRLPPGAGTGAAVPARHFPERHQGPLRYILI